MYISVYSVKSPQAHSIGLDFVLSGLKNRSDNGLCILANELSLLDKARTVPLSKPFIVIRQMLRIG